MDMNEKILDVFKTLIEEVSKHDDNINEKYKDVITLEELDLEKCELISKFLDNIDKHSKKITNKDVSVFENEIIVDVDLKKIFESEINDIDMNNIWKFLQTFCIISININSSKELQSLLSGETKEINKENKKDIKDLKKLKKIKESIKEIKDDNYALSVKEAELEEETNKNSMPDMNMMNGIFQNTGIGQLAKEIAEGIDFQSMVGENTDGEPNMENVMENIMNPNNFMNLFQNINEKVKEKMDTGELSEETLSGEAESLYGNFADNPMFKNMMNNPELQKMQEQAETEVKVKNNQKNRVEKLNKNVVPKKKKNQDEKTIKLDSKQKPNKIDKVINIVKED